MFGLPIAFTSPIILGALLLLPIIWYLLRLTPPKPTTEVFPPLAILLNLIKREETPAKSPWWLTLLRLTLATLAILAMAGPIWRPQEPSLKSEGNLILVVDDGWASGENWSQIKQKAENLLNEAQQKNLLVTLIKTSNAGAETQTQLTPEQAKALIEANGNLSIRPDHEETAKQLGLILKKAPNSQITFLSDGLLHKGTETLASAVSKHNIPTLVAKPNLEKLFAISQVENNPDAMVGKIIRANSADDTPLHVVGYDDKNLPVSRTPVIFEAEKNHVEFSFNEPVELRNQIVRIALENAKNAGAIKLLDDSNQRRIVGLVSGQSVDVSQPLLSPLYYINRALAPFSDIRRAGTANIELAIEGLLEQNISTMVLADIGKMPEQSSNELSKWVDNGGMLIRFAGPRLAAKPDVELLPTQLHESDRLIGGALSWEEPKNLAPFEANSPFFGIENLDEVRVSRQVMAIQSSFDSQDVWARLEDGTPLVTAKKQGAGWLVLFHVNSDNNWSNLPLSGTFVEMLRRSVNLSRSVANQNQSNEAVRLPPLEVINGTGNLVPPSSEIKPLVIAKDAIPEVSIENPPGLYGTSDGYVALNLITNDEELTPLDVSAFKGSQSISYADQSSQNLTPILLSLAALLFIVDCLVVLWFAGAWRARKRSFQTRNATILVAALLASFTLVSEASAQSSEVEDYSAALQARLAYVKTGIAEVDNVSEAGLRGLTFFISSRTALEPGEPIGVDIATDELAFYPILYWPIDASAPTPNEKAMARVDAFMKQGGTILFDTRDQLSGVLNRNSGSAGTLKLREILADLDIPPLEPVPPDHVLTKSFYLLDSFPGRYSGGDLWVEQIGTRNEDVNRPARAGDGVSTIMITSNDFAGAWAIDGNRLPLFATVPPNPQQREYAFRVGVNILMYMMTGNYKADQVHIPALLERLGQ